MFKMQSRRVTSTCELHCYGRSLVFRREAICQDEVGKVIKHAPCVMKEHHESAVEEKSNIFGIDNFYRYFTDIDEIYALMEKRSYKIHLDNLLGTITCLVRC